jgi:predicted SAM-dependent methyltransferase
VFGLPKSTPTTAPLRLHLGSGSVRLDGWTNVDIQALPGVDVVADVTKGLHFTDVEAIFAEHFLEHLPLAGALFFLQEAHRVLVPGGWLRLSTPNLDWVWSTHYRREADADTKQANAIMLNRAFHGWRHQFLWNREILGEALLACGFEEPRWCRHGESTLPIFQRIEHHETYADEPDLPHVIIAEAKKGPAQPERLEKLRGILERDFLSHLAD